MNNSISGFINRKLAKQMFHYGLFGVLRNSIGYTTYLLITYWGIPPKVATSLLYFTGMSINFFGSRSHIFRHEGSIRGAGVRYVVIAVIGYLINIGLFILLVDNLGYPHKWVQIAAIFIVAGYLFLSFKYFVFKNTKIQTR